MSAASVNLNSNAPTNKMLIVEALSIENAQSARHSILTELFVFSVFTSATNAGNVEFLDEEHPPVLVESFESRKRKLDPSIVFNNPDLKIWKEKTWFGKWWSDFWTKWKFLC